MLYGVQTHKAAADTLSDKPAQHCKHTYLAPLLLRTPNTLGYSLVILGTCVGCSLGEADSGMESEV